MKKTRTSRTKRGLAKAGLVAWAVTGVGLTASGVAHAGPAEDKWGFTPLTNNALDCSSANVGDPAWATGITLTKKMSAGDASTFVVGGAASTVGSENDMIAISPDGTYAYTVGEGNPSTGVDRLTIGSGVKEKLTTGPTTPDTKWSRVDGSYFYAPAAVLLIGEEYSAGTATASTQARGGGVWQVNPATGAFVRLDWLGSMAHEGITYAGGALWFGDENRTGAMFKAVPTDADDLTKGGTLSYIVGIGVDASGFKQVTNPDNAVTEAINGGAVLFDRPEDVDARNGRVYFTVTEPQGDADLRKGNYNGTAAGGASALNQVVNRGGVYSFSATGVPEIATQSGSAPYTKLTPMIEVQDPTYATAAQAQSQQGLQFPDNMAFDGRGHLWVHEDIPDGSAFPANGIDVTKQVRNQQDELYVYELNAAGDAIVDQGTVSKGVKAADMRSSDGAQPCVNEFTGGIFFGAAGDQLCINQQHVLNPTFCGSILAAGPSPVVPEAPMAIFLGASALAGLGAVTLYRRRRPSIHVAA